MEGTPNYNFPIHSDEDFFNIRDFNDMMTAVDLELKNMEETTKEIAENARKSVEAVIGGQDLSKEAITEEALAQFPVIKKSTSVTEKSLFCVDIPGLILGTYAFVIRCKASNNTGAAPLLRLTASCLEGEAETRLKMIRITPERFTKAGVFQTFSFLVEFSGDHTKTPVLRLEGTLEALETAVEVSIDYVAFSLTYGAMTSLA